MEKSVSKQELIDMIVNYYRKKEEKDVIADITTGKVVSGNTDLSKSYVLNFDVREKYVAPDGQEKTLSLPVGQSEIEKIVSTMLLEEGFNVSEVNFDTVASQAGVAFAGLTVKGDEIDLDKGISM